MTESNKRKVDEFVTQACGYALHSLPHEISRIILVDRSSEEILNLLAKTDAYRDFVENEKLALDDEPRTFDESQVQSAVQSRYSTDLLEEGLLREKCGCRCETCSARKSQIRKFFEDEKTGEGLSAQRYAELKKIRLDHHRKQEESRLQRQAECAHVKENERTRLVGYTMSNGVTHYLCNLCFKEWTDRDSIPHHLRPDMDLVGGSVIEAEQRAEDEWEAQQQHEGGADRCPPRE